MFHQRGFCLLLPVVWESYQADITLDGLLLDHTHSGGDLNCWWIWGSAYGNHSFFFAQHQVSFDYKGLCCVNCFQRKEVILLFHSSFQDVYLHRRSIERHSIVFLLLKTFWFYAHCPWLDILCYSNKSCKELLTGSATPFVL